MAPKQQKFKKSSRSSEENIFSEKEKKFSSFVTCSFLPWVPEPQKKEKKKEKKALFFLLFLFFLRLWYLG